MFGGRRKWLLISLGLLGLLGAAWAASYRLKEPELCRDFQQGNVQVGEAVFEVAYARTPAEQSEGLAGCPDLPAGRGMYFVFSPKQTPAFWMRGMLIPLDMVWIADGQVVGVEANVPALADPQQANPPVYIPPVPIDVVLEIGAGEAARTGVASGMLVREL